MTDHDYANKQWLQEPDENDDLLKAACLLAVSVIVGPVLVVGLLNAAVWFAR